MRRLLTVKDLLIYLRNFPDETPVLIAQAPQKDSPERHLRFCTHLSGMDPVLREGRRWRTTTNHYDSDGEEIPEALILGGKEEEE
ncbi:MAG: hypothetical protein ACYTG5_13460 [Planctomycetota bacterium]|jgi:hypothetical protein